MFDVEKWRQVVSGQRCDFKGRLLLLCLRVLSGAYWCVITARNATYDRGLLSVRKSPLPTISIGNITAGGTGKTPVVIWLCKLLAVKGYPLAVLTRGYKSTSSCADEPALIHQSCPQCEVVINSNRFLGALEAAPRLGAGGVLILDDGFQHRRLSRNLDILTIDATCPFGYDRLLPAGLLREPLSSIKRARAAIITRCDIATEEQINFAQWRLMRINPDMLIFKAGHKYNGIEMLDGRELSVVEISGKKCFAFCGIGNPYAFFECLFNSGISVAEYEIYQDHHKYTPKDIGRIMKKAADCDIIITTEKDFVKLKPIRTPEFAHKCGCTKMEIEFYTDTKPLEDKICARISSGGL